jgi:hypothetical protein
MLKLIFLCLLVANALLFAMWQGYLVNPIAPPHQAQRLQQQQNSQHLKLISEQVANSSAPLSCLELGPFQENELTKVDAKLNALAFGNRQTRQTIQEPTSTIVFIPSLGSKTAAEKKVAELTQLGVNDFYIIQDHSNLRWGISLGIFKSEEAAKQLTATLISKGVENVKMKARTALTTKFMYVFKDVSNSEKADLEKEFPAQNLRECK